MGDVNDMITNIAKGDLATAQQDFEDTLGAKLADRLDQHKSVIAQAVFNPEDEEDDFNDIIDELDDQEEDETIATYDADIPIEDQLEDESEY